MNIKEITPQDAVKAVEEGSVLIDVREEYELAELSYGIEHLHIPMGDIQIRIEEVPRDRDVIVGCRSGKRSMNVCMFLAMQGYDRILNLEGGIINWTESGCPTK